MSVSEECVVKQTSNPVLIYRFVKKVFPLVKKELARWQLAAESIPEQGLREQALASIKTKAFHCQGGSIYALYPGVNTAKTVEFIVAYQTISDYLDNLVDSVDVEDEQAFAQLHLAMTEALDPHADLSDYYLYYPYREDGGYLNSLIKTCQGYVASLPSYDNIKSEIVWLASLYAKLQTYKHLALAVREQKMLEWIEPHLTRYPEISAWEFAAATGSTLGVYCLAAVACDESITVPQVRKIKEAYFPWISGLHILLDYFIDLTEDKESNQLNFVAYYQSSHEMGERLQSFLLNSLDEADQLNYPRFHRAVIQGLLGMYLSDPKTSESEIKHVSKQVLAASGTGVRLLHRMCLELRRRDIL
ncbi:tetraprenyl-beta-curcumene synthase family protein [Paradesulfitobacterium aromaticivorans]